jgi:hypothetical protein
MEHSRIAQKVRNVCKVIRDRILRRTTGRRRAGVQLEATTPGAKRKSWVEQWTGLTLDKWDWQVKKLVHQDWEKRWHRENQMLGQIVQPGTDLGKRLVVPEDTLPTAQVLKLYEELRKAESALLTQACTKRIGLAEFLHRHKVPGFLTATC